jgi:hypothetical protein
MLALNAKKAGKEGWMLDLKATTYVPVMKYADNRDLRRELYMAYSTRNMQAVNLITLRISAKLPIPVSKLQNCSEKTVMPIRLWCSAWPKTRKMCTTC